MIRFAFSDWFLWTLLAKGSAFSGFCQLTSISEWAKVGFSGFEAKVFDKLTLCAESICSLLLSHF